MRCGAVHHHLLRILVGSPCVVLDVKDQAGVA